MDPLRELADRAANGDALAIDALLRALGPHLLRTIRGLLGPRSPDAEDVLQESFIRVLRALPSFRNESTVVHFAIRITMRACADAVRGYGRSRRLKAAWSLEEHTALVAPSPEHELARRQQLAQLVQDTLTPVQLETLVLVNMLGNSLIEAATLMGVPVNTVRGRLATGKRALRDRLGETDSSEGPQVLLDVEEGESR